MATCLSIGTPSESSSEKSGMITAAQRAGVLNRGIQPLAPVTASRYTARAVPDLPRSRGNPHNTGNKARLVPDRPHALRVMLNLLLMLIFLRQRLLPDWRRAPSLTASTTALL